MKVEKTFKRICPSCNGIISHIGKEADIKCRIAQKIKRNCRSCSQKGRIVTAAVREKISKSCKGVCGQVKGFKHSAEAKKLMSATRKGKCFISANAKRTLRIKAIEQHQRAGVDFPAVDYGARECFQLLNMYYGLNIQFPNIQLKELGYFLDGYDPISHAVYEFDSKDHLKSGKQQKDLIRQQEIINHYKTIGNPLKKFFRINATGVGAFNMINVLENTN